MKMQIFVMSAWIAGIQVAGCYGDIHVNLNSSTKCWNDAIKVLLKVTSPARISKKCFARKS